MIPSSLTKNAVRQWIVWRGEIRGKKMTKVPFYCRGVQASCSEGPWDTYHMARNTQQGDKKKWDGIGYVFTEDDGLVGLDLDACRNPVTGDVEDWAEQIIDSLKSYTEVSPSGSGLKVIVKSPVPSQLTGKAKRTKRLPQHTGHGDHNPEVMVVTERGYFALTGEVYKYGQIKKCPKALNGVCEELWGKASKKLDKKAIADVIPAPVEKLAKWFELADSLLVGDEHDGSSRLIRLAALCKRLGLNYEQSFYAIKAYEQSHAFPQELEEESIRKRLEDTTAELADIVLEEDETVCADDLREEKVLWLWDSWVPLGALTMVEGDPGQGKSTVCYDLASRVSAGSLMPPAETKHGRGPANVLILTAEDDVERVVLRRLRRAKAKMKRIFFMRGIKTRTGMKPIYLGAHFDLLRARVQQLKPRLVMVDPLACYMDAGFDMYRDQSVRQFLFPLVALAEEFQIALVMVRHLNKASNQKARHRGSGSIGISGAARSVLVCGRHPEKPWLQILAGNKASLAQIPVSQGYQLDKGSVRWRGEQPDVKADDILDYAEEGGKKDAVAAKTINWRVNIRRMWNQLGQTPVPLSKLVKAHKSKAITSIKDLRSTVLLELEKKKFGRVVNIGENGRERLAFEITDNPEGKPE